MERTRRVKGTMIYALCAAAVGTAAILLSKYADGFAEWYAARIFPVFPNTIGRLFSPVPFSVFEALLCAALLGLLLFGARLAVSAVVPSRRKNVRNIAAGGFRVALVVAGTAFLMVSLACTVNYERSTYAALTNQTVEPSTKAELFSLCERLIADAGAVAGEIPVDGDGLFTTAGLDVKGEARASMERLGADVPALSGYYPNPKPVLLSTVMSSLNLTGIYSPVTVEANYNRDTVDYVIPYTICHELAHLKGFMREDEAGFIAYLACLASETPEFRYSGTLNALRYVLNACAREAEPEEYARLRDQLPEQVRRDLLANYAYWQRFQGRPAAVAVRVNDSYLKMNAQEDGVKSYGRMIDLLLAKYRDDAA